MFKKVLLSIIVLTVTAGVGSVGIALLKNKPDPFKKAGDVGQAVLAAATEAPHFIFKVNVPSFFNDTAQFTKSVAVEGGLTVKGKAVFESSISLNNNNLDLGTGTITAANVLYGVKAGNGVTISTGQTPTIAVNNTGVTSLQSQTGALTLTAGSGITIDGLKISNEDAGSSQNIFKTITSGGTSFSAGSNNDTLTFTAGSGVTITPDASNKKLTFTATGGTVTGSGFTTDGIMYATGGSAITSLTPGTSGYILQSNGTGVAPSWIANSGSNPSFASIATGTNTAATMTIGSGATLTYTGTGIINATELLGNTWVSPGTIGSTTPNTGSFTTLSASGTFSANGGLTMPSGQNLTLSGFTAGSIPYINSSNQLAQDNTNFFWDATNKRLGLGTNTPSYVLAIATAQNNAISVTNTSNNNTNFTVDKFGNVTALNLQYALNSSYGLFFQSDSTSLPGKLNLNNTGTTLASADIRLDTLDSGFGTLPIASISGKSSFAGLVVDNSGLGDIFTASSSGLNRFVITQAGNVGIGTTNPNTTLHVVNTTATDQNPIVEFGDNTSSTRYQFLADRGGGSVFYMNGGLTNIRSNGSIGFQNTNTTNMYVGSTGSVGIGTTSPLSSSGLDIEKNTLGNAALVVNNSGGAGDIFTASSAGTPKVVINSSGYLGIGTTNPTSPLYVNGSTNDMVVMNSSLDTGFIRPFEMLDSSMTTGHNLVYHVGHDLGTNDTAYFGFNYQGANSTNNFITLGMYGADNLVNINASGNLGIATQTPKNKLDVVGSAAIGSYAGTNTAPSNSLIVSGNVGIGTNNPSNALDVTGGSNDMVVLTSTLSNSFIRPLTMLDSNMTTGQNLVYHIGHDESTNNTGYIGFHYVGSGNPENWLTMGFWGIDNIYNFTPSGHVGFGTTAMGNGALVVNQTNSSGDLFSASAAGSTKFVIANNGNIDIGTTNLNTAELNIKTATNANGWAHTDGTVTLVSWIGNATNCTGGTACAQIGTTTNHRLDLFTNGSVANASLLPSGYFGLNTVTPGSLLDVRGNSGTLTVNGTVAVASISGKTSFASLVVDNAGKGDLFTASSSGLSRFVITQNGNIGIGTTTPAEKLQVNGNILVNNNSTLNWLDTGGGDNQILWMASDNNVRLKSPVNGSVLYLNPDTGTQTSINFNQNGNIDLVAGTSTGSVGIGITSPLTRTGLDIEKNSLGNAALAVNNSGGAGDIFTASSAGNAKFVIDKNGSVGIGTTSPQRTLHVLGTSVFDNSNNPSDWTDPVSLIRANINQNDWLWFHTGSPSNIGGSTIRWGWGMTGGTDDLFLRNGTTSNSFLGQSDSVLRVSRTTGNLALGFSESIGTVSPLASSALDIETNSLGNADLVVNNAGGQGDIFTASSAGTPVFNINKNGNTRLTGSLCVKATFTTACAGSTAGTIYATNTTVQSADVAENYVSSQTLEPGDVIMPAADGDNQAVIKTTSAYQNQTIGIVSTKPGVTLNSDSLTDGAHPNLYPIALQGRVPVKVTSMNGIIHTGDLLTSSAIPGAAMKATNPGQIIGKALEDYTDTNTMDVGKIMVFVNISWADPNMQVTITDTGDINLNGQPVVTTASVNTQNQTPTNGELTGLKNQVASLSAQIAKVYDLSNQLASLQKDINREAILQASSAAGINLTTEATALNGTLTVSGKTTLTDLGITGRITDGLLAINGLDDANGTPSATINTLSAPLKIQSLAINTVDFENGKVVIDTNGNVSIHANLTANSVTTDKLNITTDKTATDSGILSASTGSVSLAAGKDSIDVQTTALTNKSLIFLTPNLPVSVGYKIKNNNTFTIYLKDTVQQNLTINWWIIN